MTENEAIELLKNNYPKTRKMVDGRLQGGFDDHECDVGIVIDLAIKALKEIQQYRELEKRLTGMFSGELSLETVVDELERQLKEPDNPHPINAKILTYEDAAAWDAYHAIGTPEECRAAMEKPEGV